MLGEGGEHKRAQRLRCGIVAAAVLPLLLGGCGGGQGPRADATSLSNDSPTIGSLTFTTRVAGNSSAITALETVVIRDSQAWLSLWQRHAALMVPPTPPPEFDFSSQMIVGVFLGNRPDGCYAVTVQSVAVIGQALVVEYSESGGGQQMACPAVITQPHHLVRLAATALEVRFVSR